MGSHFTIRPFASIDEFKECVRFQEETWGKGFSERVAIAILKVSQRLGGIAAGAYDGLDPQAIPQITTEMPIRPDGPYGIGKAFGEAAGRHYSDRYGMSVICLRIGTVNRENNPLASVRQFATLCTHRDIAQLVRLCLEARDLGFEIFYGVSDNTWRFWDIEHARKRVGYAPEDDAESWRAEFEAEQG